MQDTYNLETQGENALHNLQNTKLSPMEEQLFKSWATANQVKNPDAPGDPTDYRGIYKNTGGQVQPHGQLAQLVNAANSEQTLMRVMQDRMRNSVLLVQEKAKADAQKHQQEMEKLDYMRAQKEIKQPGPGELQVHKMKLEGLQHQNKGTAIKNEGKKLDITKTLVTPPAEEKTSSSSSSKDK